MSDKPKVEMTYYRTYAGGTQSIRDLRVTIDGRPLVVIDPESPEDAERLWRSWRDLAPDHHLAQDNLQAALREFANPSPPRIDEPGTWGVVEASCVHSDERREWMRHRDGNWYVVGTDTKNNPDDWDSLIDPVLVREGVTP